MSYIRVIPRDLFNEGNLLKCYGQVYIALETSGFHPSQVSLEYDPAEEQEGFIIARNPDDGSLSLANVFLQINQRRYDFRRPINSREPYPLYLVVDEEQEIAVFHKNGTFTEEMLSFLASAVAKKQQSVGSLADGSPYSGTGSSRVVRGASWFNHYRGYLQSASRNFHTPSSRYYLTGFRVVFTLGNKNE